MSAVLYIAALAVTAGVPLLARSHAVQRRLRALDDPADDLSQAAVRVSRR